MADRGSKSDADSASVDTLLEGVLGGDVQSAKARSPKKGRQETAPGLSVIVAEESGGPGPEGRRRPFMSEQEEIARMAPTVPPATRNREIPRDTVVDEGGDTVAPSQAKRHLPPWAIAVIVLLVGVAAFAASRRISADARRDEAEVSARQAAEKIKAASSSASAIAATALAAMPPGTVFVSTAPPASSAAPTSASSAAPVSPASTYGHLVPGGRH